jgi:HEAT repeat protein
MKGTSEGGESQEQSSLGAAHQPGSRVAELIAQLSSPRAATRERARQGLVALGRPAVEPLVASLSSTNEQARLEATKALAEIADPSAIPALARALEADQQDIRWVAAEGLVNIGSDAVEPVLRALIDGAARHTILDAANHVLHAFARRSSEPIFEPVLAALKGPEPAVSAPLAAENALIKWRQLSAEVAAGLRRSILRMPRSHADGKKTPITF